MWLQSQILGAPQARTTMGAGMSGRKLTRRTRSVGWPGSQASPASMTACPTPLPGGTRSRCVPELPHHRMATAAEKDSPQAPTVQRFFIVLFPRLLLRKGCSQCKTLLHGSPRSKVIYTRQAFKLSLRSRTSCRSIKLSSGMRDGSLPCTRN